MNLPQDFITRMQELLKEEFDSFLSEANNFRNPYPRIPVRILSRRNFPEGNVSLLQCGKFVVIRIIDQR